MTRWTGIRISPYAVFVTVLAAVAAAVLVFALLARREAPAAARRGMMPFPASQADAYRLDDVAGHLHHPNTERTVIWPEHPAGRFELRTNNLGFREDRPTNPRKASGTHRMLVTGDSHIDGVLANSESFANRLERLLDDADGRTFEVINGGIGHYGPHNYLGMLRRCLDLDIDDFVVVIFTGNDLLDAVAEAWVRGELEIPDRPPNYMARLEDAHSRSTAAVSQGLNQIMLFWTFPELRTAALQITREVLATAARICDDHDIGLYVVLLPPKHDVEPEHDAVARAEVVDALGLSAGDLDLNQRMTRELASALGADGIPVLDASRPMADSNVELFWRRDHHLNVAGHELLARLFFDRFGARLLDPPSPAITED